MSKNFFMDKFGYKIRNMPIMIIEDNLNPGLN